MKILLVTDYYLPVTGGISTMVDSLADGLRENRHEVFIYTVSGGSGHRNDHGLTAVRATHTSNYFPFLFKNKAERNMPPVPDPLFLRGLEIIIKEFEPNVIHAHGWVMFPVASLSKKYPDLAKVATLHDYGFVCPKRDLVFKPNNSNASICQRTWVGVQCIRCASRVYGLAKSLGMTTCLRLFERLPLNLNRMTAASEYLAIAARKKYGGAVDVVPNFIDPSLKTAPSLYSSAPETDLLFVGRLSREKGIALLLEAYSLLRRKLPWINLTVVGKPDPYYSLRITDQSIAFHQNIGRDSLLALYRKAKIVVIPSIWAEPQPMVALESMAFQKPIVATNVGGLKEMVEHHKTGLIVEPDAYSLANALEYLLSNPGISKEMGIEGRMRLMRKYIPSVVIPRFEKIYRCTAD